MNDVVNDNWMYLQEAENHTAYLNSLRTPVAPELTYSPPRPRNTSGEDDDPFFRIRGGELEDPYEFSDLGWLGDANTPSRGYGDAALDSWGEGGFEGSPFSEALGLDFSDYDSDSWRDNPRIAQGIVETAAALDISPMELAQIISFETGGTFDPRQKGPTTKWGQHQGFIQFGEPQARELGVDWNDPIGSQLGADGAIVRYARRHGFEPGMGAMRLYSTINAGNPNRLDASDTAAGGTWGTVRDKFQSQIPAHADNASRLLNSLGY